jgi:hypothetical protein
LLDFAGGVHLAELPEVHTSLMSLPSPSKQGLRPSNLALLLLQVPRQALNPPVGVLGRLRLLDQQEAKEMGLGKVPLFKVLELVFLSPQRPLQLFRPGSYPLYVSLSAQRPRQLLPQPRHLPRVIHALPLLLSPQRY